MREEYEYRLNSSNSSLSGLCEAWNKVYNLNGSQMEYEIPEQAGNGRLTGFCSGRRIRVINYDINFSKPVDMTGYSGTPHMDLLFCLGEQAGWDFPESGKVFHICQGESYIGTSFETRKRSVFSPGTHMHILEIKVPLADIHNIYDNIDNTRAGERSSFKEFSTGKYGLTPSVQAMIRQMSDCPYKGYLRQLYMEGKVYELIAVFFSETVLQKDNAILIPDFSKADLNCIYQAKRLLDEAPERNVSLPLLSRCVGLNEYKLKKGFKEVYGVSVHSYVIQKRLELAKTILDMEDVTVSDAAGRVGYGNVSHFAAAFRKRYGSNPGQYLRDVRD